MPLGIVSDSEFELEVNLTDKKSNTSPNPPIIIDKPNPGRSNGDNNVPDSLRKVISEEALIEGRQSAIRIAESFGISPSSTSAYSNGATSTDSYHKPNQSISSHLNKVRERITRKASNRLISSLDSITPEKLENSKPTEAASVAQAMSVIIKNMEPERNSQPSIGPNFVFYSPKMKKEEDYEVIQLNE